MSVDTLYIIGNGFDLAHDLPTRYQNFRSWLREKAADAENDEKLKSVINVLIYIIDECERKSGNCGEYWSRLEEYCGEIDLSQGGINLQDRSWFDEEGEEHDLPYSSAERGEEVNGFVDTVGMLNVLFAQWVDSLSSRELTEKAMGKKIDYFADALRGKNYAILTFNYTDTLEKIYGVDAENICHIHGKQGANTKYYFGHGKEVPKTNELNGIRSFARYYADSLSDEDGEFYPNIQISNMLFKDVKKVIQEHEAFFAGLSGVKEIYVYGFGFGKVDMPYISKISKMSPGAVWHIHQHGQNGVSDELSKRLHSLDENMDIEDWDVK